MHNDLSKPVSVRFSDLYIDPNNPRVRPEERPGYVDAKPLFDPVTQAELEKTMEEVYDVKDLEDSIVHQGWVPIDPILVWEHPKRPAHYTVVEGNTRTVVLKKIRKRYTRETEKLQRMLAHAKKFDADDLDAQKAIVAQLKAIIADTDSLHVHPVVAKTAAELEEKLPRILGVRHVTHAKQWGAYATNLYMLSLYRRFFYETHPKTKTLILEPDIVERVGDVLSTGSTKARRCLQAAAAFSHFKRNFEDRLSPGDRFGDDDQYFFENILQNKYAYEQFRFTPDRLHLEDEMEEALYEWAFKFPRTNADDSKNAFRKAEDIRLWARMKAYDDDAVTAFATQLNVSDPKSATPMRELEVKYLTHKQKKSPVDTLNSLIDSLKKMNVETLLDQEAHLRPMLVELRDRSALYLKMLDSAAERDAVAAAGGKNGPPSASP